MVSTFTFTVAVSFAILGGMEDKNEGSCRCNWVVLRVVVEVVESRELAGTFFIARFKLIRFLSVPELALVAEGENVKASTWTW